jgi:hypothetical protein
MIQLSNGCSFCHKARWCQNPLCVGAKSMTPQERARAGLPPISPAKPVPNKPDTMANKPADMANSMANSMANMQSDMANTGERMANTPAYRYRDPEARRAYMREYMARRRAQKKRGLT